MISSLYALGYHERIETGSCPEFLRDLRRTAFASVYSADKNVSIFLGRPHRIHRRYCTRGALSYLKDYTDDHSRESDGPENAQPPTTTDFDYRIEAWWTAQCAVLKERILELSDEVKADQRQVLAR